MKNKIAHVVPVRDFPTTTSGFDYLIPDNFNCFPGELCQIDFRNSPSLGVVLAVKEKSDFSNLKPVQLLDKNIIFSRGWLETVLWFSAYYHFSVGSTLKYFFPKFGKKINFNIPNANKAYNVLKVDNQGFKKIAINQQQPILIHAPSQTTIIDYYKYLADRYHSQNKSIVIICPDQTTIKNLSSHLSDYPIINLDSSLTDKLWRENWLKTFASGFKIILTTQKGSLAPINNLGLIVVDQENSALHVQSERNPRFDNRWLAYHYGQNSKVPVIYTSLSVSLFSASLIQQKKLVYYAISLNKRPKFKVIDYNLETVGSDNLFGPVCQQAINNCLHKQQPVFIFSFFHQPKNSYCFYCGSENSLANSYCKKCHQLLVVDKKSLIGIKNELAKINYEPQSADLYSESVGKIFVGGLKHLNKINNLGLTIILDADNILNIPNFYASEKLRSIVDYLSQASQQTLIISKNPQHHVFDSDFKNYLKSELNIRKKYHLPPYGDICHISCAKFEPTEINSFKNNLKKLDSNLTITGPLLDKLNRNEYLIIKSDQAGCLAKISDFMYSKWMLDRQPTDLLR